MNPPDIKLTTDGHTIWIWKNVKYGFKYYGNYSKVKEDGE